MTPICLDPDLPDPSAKTVAHAGLNRRVYSAEVFSWGSIVDQIRYRVVPFKARNWLSLRNVNRQLEILNRTGRYHSIELPDGRVLEGVQSIDRLKRRLAEFPVPDDLTGKRVLDIGAWDGWFSFEMERRGAEVVAVDCAESKAFRAAHDLLQSKVDYRILDMDELCPAAVGRFDIVLFLGVLYHLRYPLLGLERVCQLTRDVAFVESFVTDNGLKPRRAAMEFYELDELGGRHDNWYGPSTSCVLALCRSAGFARVELGRVVEQRVHVICRRRWELPPTAPKAPAPVLRTALNDRDRNTRFPKNKDLHGCCVFSTPETGLKPVDLRIELDGYGVPALLLSTAAGENVWEATFRLPTGLPPGPHEVRLRTVNSPCSNTATVDVIEAVNSALPF